MGDPELASLRAMLLGPEQRRLDALQTRLDDPDARAEDIGAVLPRVLLEHAQDPHFARALTPPLEKAITTSVQRNPKPLADALFPVMGPAIRKAVSAGLASMVDSLNRTLEHSLSGKSIQWRLEAWRTGKSFGEVVLLKTLLYRVEQAFLIDRKTGLLLQHASSGTVGVQDADMVSGMLTAIKDFVQDSFRVSETDSLESLKVGELNVWIEPGPHAILAAVIRGTAPRDFRRTLQDSLESIHLQFAHALEAFNGDASALEDARATLDECLQSQYRADERKPRSRGAWILASVVVLVLLTWIGFTYRAYSRWNTYLAKLRVEPGLVVVSAEREGGTFVVKGLRDPLARDPSHLLEGTGLAAGDVKGEWALFHALNPSLVIARATSVLQPPSGVAFTLKDDVLSSTGPAPLAWVADARRLAPLVTGISRFDAAGALEGTTRSTIAELESLPLLFAKGSSRLTAGGDEALLRAAVAARSLDAIAAAAGQRYRLDIVGHTDSDGAPDANLPLSRARADVVGAALRRDPLQHVEVTISGVGSDAPIVVGQNEEDKQKNRCATIRVSRLELR